MADCPMCGGDGTVLNAGRLPDGRVVLLDEVPCVGCEGFGAVPDFWYSVPAEKEAGS